jgi:hypothetical protein
MAAQSEAATHFPKGKIVERCNSGGSLARDYAVKM